MRFAAQIVQRQARGRKLMAVGGFDIAMPEMLAQTKTARQVKNNLDIGARFAAGPRRCCGSGLTC